MVPYLCPGVTESVDTVSFAEFEDVIDVESFRERERAYANREFE